MTLKNTFCLVTAGPTYEAIDPVRFIGNRSSGKMGIELSKALLEQGANVYLVLGPSSISIEPQPNLTITRVESAEEMYQAVMEYKEDFEIGIFAAAVADYRPVEVSDEKIKKEGEFLQIKLEKTKDILKTVGESKRTDQFLVGFALETNNEEEHAKRKLEKKHLDMIVLNSLQDSGAGFQHDTNRVTIYDKNNKKAVFELKTKREVAQDIINYILTLRGE